MEVILDVTPPHATPTPTYSVHWDVLWGCVYSLHIHSTNVYTYGTYTYVYITAYIKLYTVAHKSVVTLIPSTHSVTLTPPSPPPPPGVQSVG